MDEQEVLSEVGFAITTARVITPQQTFAMAGITSVRMYREKLRNGCPAVVLVLGLVFLLAFIILVSVGDKEFIPEPNWFLMSCIIAAVIWAFSRVNRKPKWVLGITTAAGETPAWSSHDKAFVERLANAITQAMARRG